MSIYKECDIRGIYGEEFGDDTAYAIGRAVGGMMAGKTLAVGGDVRISTPVLKAELMRGLMASGTNIVDIGMVPTPVFYFALKEWDMDGGITVTASHNPAKYNGFKLMFGQLPVTPEIMAEIESRVEAGSFPSGKGETAQKDVIRPYRGKLLGSFGRGSLKVVIDCANGAMSELAPEVFSGLGYDVVPLYCTFDGSFPNRDPNPANYASLKALSARVTAERASLGVGFDGDGDRVVFVDEKGAVIPSEKSFVIIINDVLKRNPAPVVYDLKSSSIVKDAIQKNGGEPLMERSGHAFIKRRFLTNRAALAGEISGHFFFRELGYDDGLYAALVMARILEKSGKPLSEIAGDIPATVITPDIRIFCPYEKRDALLQRAAALAEGYEVSYLDGVRVDFGDGWLLVRKSVTEEAVTFRIEAKDEAVMARIKKLLYEKIPEFNTGK